MTVAASDALAVIQALPHGGDAEVAVDGRRLRFTHLDRVLWPLTATTKRDVLAYYASVAPWLLPELQGRAVTLARFPEGVDGPAWYQAQCRGRPPWVPVHEIAGRRGGSLRYCVFEEVAAVLWAANLGTLEFHPFAWRTDAPDRPTSLILDLDPGAPASIVQCCELALLARPLLEDLNLRPSVQTSGGLGLHVRAPLPDGWTFRAAKQQARDLAAELARAAPDLAIDRSARSERAGLVYVDWIQNDPARSLVAAYSLRALPVPQVAMPIGWDEVAACAAAGRGTDLRFGPADALRRITAPRSAGGR